MSFLTVRHSTVYRYREPVGLGEHRMMFRPRASHDLRLIRTRLVITPEPAHLRWLHDPFDNSVAVATFDGTTSELSFESTVTLEHFDRSGPEYPLEEYARTYPFRYSDEDFPNLVITAYVPVSEVAKAEDIPALRQMRREFTGERAKTSEMISVTELPIRGTRSHSRW